MTSVDRAIQRCPVLDDDVISGDVTMTSVVPDGDRAVHRTKLKL